MLFFFYFFSKRLGSVQSTIIEQDMGDNSIRAEGVEIDGIPHGIRCNISCTIIETALPAYIHILCCGSYARARLVVFVNHNVDVRFSVWN